MVLQNFVVLQPGIPAKLHFTDHTIAPRTITDPLTGVPTTRNTLQLIVDTLNDRPVLATYSTMAEKHAQQFAPYLPNKTYVKYDFTITMTGEGFRRSWSVQVTPRS